MSAVQNGLGKPADKKAKIEAIAKRYKDLELAILTPAQRVQLEKEQAKRKALFDKFKAVEKSLTPQQRDKGRAIQLSFKRKGLAVMKSKTLTNVQKAAQLTRLQSQRSAALKAILTQQQRAALPR